MTASYEFLDTSTVIPVIAIESLEHAIPLAEALVAGGIVNLEVTLRTQHGLDAIRLISEQVSGANVGLFRRITRPIGRIIRPRSAD